MIKTIPVDYIGQQNLGYVLLALPSKNFKSQVGTLLNKLTAKLPGIIWPMPPEQLHITLCEIIQIKDYNQDKETLFRLHQEQYENAPVEILSKVPKFKITFDTIEVSPLAIIARASDSSAFNSIRTKLIETIQLPAETKSPPDITHSTIARYLKEVELETIQGIVSMHNLVLEEEIIEFKLLQTTKTPLQEYKILKTFPLATG